MKSGKKAGSSFHQEDYIYAINFDPLAKLALAVAAAAHDVDRYGILHEASSAQAEHYKGRCLVQQNAFDIAWGLLEADHFKTLRNFIFTAPEDMIRFRQLLVNLILATGMRLAPFSLLI